MATRPDAPTPDPRKSLAKALDKMNEATERIIEEAARLQAEQADVIEEEEESV